MLLCGGTLLPLLARVVARWTCYAYFSSTLINTNVSFEFQYQGSENIVKWEKRLLVANRYPNEKNRLLQPPTLLPPPSPLPSLATPVAADY